jgi:MSHA biogenesis protein MshP
MSPLAGHSGSSAARQAGFSLVAAVFLIVVLAALGAFVVQIAMTQYQGADLEVLGARAQAAAEAGIGYGATRALTTPPTCRNPYRPLNLTQGALAGFVVTVTCNATSPHQIYSGTPPTPQNYVVYALTATASYGAYGRPDYVARRATRNVTPAPP